MAKNNFEVGFIFGAKKASSFDKTFNSIKSSVAGMGKTMLVAGTAGAIAAGAAITKLGKDVIDLYGELEQNIGGSEAVFGRYAKNIQKVGEDAYKNLGVSQSEYLATANKMGALFQGSGIEQRRSLELTEQAMQRAADMASVMGIDQQIALESVAGAAKGNFTMMDNLGVAMNATNIEAYALGKGMDFAWNKASQAEKAEVAMQMFFEQTEQYAGNFARESMETISGSVGMLKASFQSLIAGLGNSDADIAKLTRNFGDAFGAVVKNITPVIKNMFKMLPGVLKTVFKEIGPLARDLARDLLPKPLADGIDWIVSKFEKAKPAIEGFVSKFNFKTAQSTFSGFFNVARSGLDFILPKLGAIAEAVGDIFAGGASAKSGVGSILETLGLTPETIAAVFEFADSIKAGFSSISQTVAPVFGTIKDAVISIMPTMQSMANYVIQNVLPMLQSLGSFITTYVVPPFAKFAEEVIPKLANTFNNLWAIIQPVMDSVISQIKLLWEIAQPIFGEFIDTVSTAVSGIVGALDGLIQFVANVFTGNWTDAWEGLKNMFGSIMEMMVELAKAPLSAIITLLNKAIGGLNKIKIPDWVPGIGGKGINIPEIPMLASGGIVTKPTLSMIGEGNESEAVLPLSKLQSLIDLKEGAGTALLKQVARFTPSTETSNFTYSPQIIIQGNADERVINEALALKYTEVKAMIERYNKEKNRKGLDN